MSLPEPLVPVECTMAGNDWFPLHFDRLRKSKWWRRASDLARARNVMLWGEAYKQVPGGSMPDDDDDLAEAAGFGMDVEAFIAAKPDIMAPWVLCIDGRWYHPTVCEVVLEAWEKTSDKRKAAAAKKAAQRAKTRGQAPREHTVPAKTPAVPPENELVPRDTAENGRDKHAHNREDRTERTGDSSVPDGTGAEAPSQIDDLADLRALEPRTGAWRLAVKVLMARGQYPESRARPLVGKWTKAHAPSEVWQACEAAWKAGTLDPVSYITAALERLGEEDALTRPSETRQRLWMQDFAASPRDWRDHERGPRPGEIGCRVTAEIQREFGVEPAKPQAVAVIA